MKTPPTFPVSVNLKDGGPRLAVASVSVEQVRWTERRIDGYVELRFRSGHARLVEACRRKCVCELLTDLGTYQIAMVRIHVAGPRRILCDVQPLSHRPAITREHHACT